MSKTIHDRVHEVVATLNQQDKWATIYRVLPLVDFNGYEPPTARSMVSQVLKEMVDKGRLQRKVISNPERDRLARYQVYGYALGVYFNGITE